MTTVIMQMTMEEPASEEMVAGMKQAAEACFEINDIDRKVTYLSQDKKNFVCVMEARDVESARRALESAKIPYGSLWAATSF